MSLLDHVQAISKVDWSVFHPFLIEGQTVGWIAEETLALLGDWRHVLQQQGNEVYLNPELATVESRSEALAEVSADLKAFGELPGWRGELMPVSAGWGQEPLALIERAATYLFGIKGWAVHLNGYCRKDGEIHVWVARRAETKATYPGMLDNLVAGGQPYGEGLSENLVRECGEEAGMLPDLAARAHMAGFIGYCYQEGRELVAGEGFCFDLEMSGDFLPHNSDGEVAEFRLLPACDVVGMLRDGTDFCPDSGLCFIDFFMRHGLITAENEPDYVTIQRMMKRA